MSIKRINPEEEEEQIASPDFDHVAGSGEEAVRAYPVFPYFTYVLIAALAAVYLAQLACGFENSYNLADSYHPAIFQGEYWRLITGAAMHGGNYHVFLNCLALYNLGSAIEFLSNRAHLAIVFFLSVIGGGLLSLFLSPEISSVGASGGIVGLLGYLFVYGYKRRKLLPPGFLKNMLINIGIMVVIGVVGYKFIDNGAHLGGLLTGALYAFLQVPGDLHKDPREVRTPIAIAGYLSLAIFLGFAVFTIFLLRKSLIY